MPREMVSTFAEANAAAAFFARIDEVATLTQVSRDAARNSIDVYHHVPQTEFEAYRTAVIAALYAVQKMMEA